MAALKYEYIIVGGGSAGCVLANRLSASATNRVLLVEAGGPERGLLVRMPSAFSYAMNIARFNWGYHSEPEPHLDGRRLACPRGRLLGGSSSINGMVYVRGHRCDFDEWEREGARGWHYQNCLPYFRRSESWEKGGNHYRGESGPLGICSGNEMRLNPLYAAFIEAGAQAGFPRFSDHNAEQQEGFGPMQMTVKDGVRSSTARAYLYPVRARQNLRVLTGANVLRVIVDDNKSAKGIEFIRDGRTSLIQASKEVVLCAGAIGSPALLERSGIGAREVLENAGVPLLHELPGVGENLQDHLEVYVQFECLQPITLNGLLNPLGKTRIGLRWLLTRKGLGSTNHFEAGAFVRSDPGVDWPDVQFHFLPAAMRYDGGSAFKGHGYQVHIGPNKPRSRGHVHITSSHVDAHPKIQFNYLEHEQDVRDWRKCVHLARKVMYQAAFDAYRGREIQPGPQVVQDAEIDAWVRQNAESAYHPSCTCRMGDVEDENAVVDPGCQVRGVKGLRVVDASVFPTITNGNLNAPTIMVAERVADMILGSL